MLNKIPPPIFAILTGGLMFGIAELFVDLNYEHQYTTYVAGVFIVVGLFIDIFAAGAFRKEGTTINPLSPEKATKLVTTGLFRFSRNPMYVGMLLILVGWMIKLGNPINVLLLLGFYIFITAKQIIPEEKALLKIFGDDYKAYMDKTPRWF